MTTAFNILCDRGQDAFSEFCKKTNMPSGDIEAVENKYRMAFNINELIEKIG
jgi:hypothetical protein